MVAVISACFHVPEHFRRRGTCIVGAFLSILSFMLMIMSAAYSQHPHELIELSDGTISEETIRAIYGILVAISVVSAVMVILSILIIFGAQTQRPLLLLPWIGFYAVTLILYTMGIISQVVSLVFLGATTMATITMLGGVITAWIGMYMILIVYYHYCDLKKLNF